MYKSNEILMMTKKSLLLLTIGIATITPTFAQKFTKKEKERAEARAANYFYGHSFTLTGGYEHSWITNGEVTATTTKFGQSECLKNTHDAFNVGFLWDYAFNPRWGMQYGLYYTQKGGEKISYYDNGFGVGPLPKSEDGVLISGLELQGMARYFIPLTHKSRLSINAGAFITKFLNGEDDGIRKWDMGLQCGLGYDYKHLALSATYQPGIYSHIAKNSDARMNAFSVNVGFRFWRK